METQKQIFAEYEKGVAFKAGLGKNGLYEQSKINERFYIGDQWHGAKCGNERPLVRYNLIKRIGDYKISCLLADDVTVKYTAAGVSDTQQRRREIRALCRNISAAGSFEPQKLDRETEISLVTSALSLHREALVQQTGFCQVIQQALRNAFISGTGIVYTYWDSDCDTGIQADYNDDITVKGSIACQNIKAENVYFGDPYSESVDEQPYIIISGYMTARQAMEQAARYGAGQTVLSRINDCAEHGKVPVLTKLYKRHAPGGDSIMAVRVCRNAVIRGEWDTRLHRYPIASFVWEPKNSCAYGESEVTYLIPNQIALNRLITAGVWSGMSMGMPIMVINGDTVSGEITNDPGQIIKVYGSNEDVAGAVRYTTPPDFSGHFQNSIDDLIKNTLYQSGANEAALGDMQADNATAITKLRNAAMLPMEILRRRYYSFIEELALIWADLWMAHYGNRKLCIKDENGVWYLPFSAERYSGVKLGAQAQPKPETDKKAAMEILNKLYDRGEIDAGELVINLPDGIIDNKQELLYAMRGEKDERN